MADGPTPEIPIPTVQDLCLRTPLYSTVDVSSDDCRELLEVMKARNFQIDAYCLTCKRDSVFKTARSFGSGSGRTTPPQDWPFRDAAVVVELHCVRCSRKYEYWFQLQDRKLCKAGQLPSMEDIAGADLNRFRAVLDRADFSELHRAGGLASYGIGIGSFVYLRRIFERLISKAKKIADARGEEVQDFDRLRIDQKIEALKGVLPPALVKNKTAYGILSLGVHQLDEQTCLKHFPVVRAAIIQMLEQDLAEQARAAAEEDLEREIRKVSGDLRKAGSREV
ncbi:hypothetical protein IVA98_03995 [Bradyrhizobium sp. 160]|uniref:hypothetical protein n=1 Tax=Bradyrhizobium sp. 160 TaxID=2782634 RepID=UPI001FFB4D85|nr:hypothetical protein [Bradyrhizobium sp. 160]MCK1622418.1 hypothetical protein [Bradyrhizobium sp. 160]